MKKALVVGAFAASVLLPAAYAQLPVTVEKVDVMTGTSASVEPDYRLFLSSPATFASRAPVGTELWFVSDGGAPGVPTGSVSKQSIDDIFSGSGDDTLFATATVDGVDTIFNEDGRFQQGNMAYPSTAQNKPVYVYLWGDLHGGDAGDTFGLLELTSGNGQIVAPSGLGNFKFFIDQDIYANTFSVVPEPTATVAVMALICLGVAAARSGQRQRD